MTNRLQIQRLATLEALQPLQGDWNALAGDVPFRRQEWLESWWRAYGSENSRELLVLSVHDGRRIVGIAPWYCEGPAARRTIRFLGSGEVCSDYLSILCAPGYQAAVTRALVDWLCDSDEMVDRPAWELLELGNVRLEDTTVACMTDYLGERGSMVYCRGRSNCWRLNLPATWEAYLSRLSKSHRKQIRRLERDYFQSGRAHLQLTESTSELNDAVRDLISLHQRRRMSLGDEGRFSSARFTDFVEQVACRLLDAGALRLARLQLDGECVAVEFQVLSSNVVYAYQSGIDPTALKHEPGRLITIATIQRAIAEGRRAFDFLRGDESYKAHWRAYPLPTHDVRVVCDSPVAHLRHNVRQVGDNLKQWFKQFTASRVACS